MGKTYRSLASIGPHIGRVVSDRGMSMFLVLPIVYSCLLGVASGLLGWQRRPAGEPATGAGPTKAPHRPVCRTPRTGGDGAAPARELRPAQVARLLAGLI